jgi:hypothetical protein
MADALAAGEGREECDYDGDAEGDDKSGGVFRRHVIQDTASPEKFQRIARDLSKLVCPN